MKSTGRHQFWLGMGAGAAATGAVVAIGVGVVVAVDAASTPKMFEITGTFDITGSTTTLGLPTGFACAGAKGYDDLSPAAAVTVSDESKTLLSKGRMTGSTRSGRTCTFDFTITDVPRGHKFYEVEIAHRGGLSYTESEAEQGLSLSIGS
ncbi:hypothetical protein [Prescottella subtropica]|uniref:hypothetical protein n=1 Tax=Prescottella subtropica TaxID=2545757 RepID=UPI0010FA6253|nr:hypothetical protein [Prescottella subtropica]